MGAIAGRTLSHYKVLEEISRGGMGVVYRAVDLKLNREVAFKVLPQELVADADRRRRFVQEAKAAAALNHPHIAVIYEVGEESGVDFIAMELIRGVKLRALLPAGGLAPQRALELAAQLADALAAAHARGIVHRDLKPENVMVTEEGQAKVIDFGLAKLLEGRAVAHAEVDTATQEGTAAGTLLGTTAYMSPEQACGAKVDHRSDVFSFGIVLYEMLTGRRPFGGATLVDTLHQIVHSAPAPLERALAGDATPVLQRLLDSCLAKLPDARYQDAGRLLADLAVARRRLEASPAAGAARSRLRRLAIAAGAALAALGVLLLAARGIEPRAVRVQSVAVLPLANLSADPEQEFFADGMTEALIADLARIQALRVISRTSAMRYKGTRKSLPEIARELGVDGIVEGSVLRSGERVRITAHLLEGASERRLWNAAYERDLRDVLSLQAEVARAIAEEIKVAVTPEEKAQLAGRKQVDPRAYQHYLAGRFHWNKRTADGLRKGLASFQQAIAIDPDYAAAHAGLADCYTMGNFWGVFPTRDAIDQARAAALKAISLDENFGGGHRALAEAAEAERDWPTAHKEYERAIELDPSDPIAHQWRGSFLSTQSRHDEAIRELQRACELDPLSLIINATYGLVLYNARRYEEAIAQYRKTIELDPTWGPGHQYLGQPLVLVRRHDEAVAELQKAVELTEGSRAALGFLAYAYADGGKVPEARRVLQRLTTPTKDGHVEPYPLALAYAGLGDEERAFAALARAADERSLMLALLNVEPMFDRLRDHPRFTALLRRIGFAK